jgi:hypothetical protein
VQTSEVTKSPLEKELFEIPAGYREVKTVAELNGVSTQQAVQSPMQQQAMQQAMQQPMPSAQNRQQNRPSMAQMGQSAFAAMGMPNGMMGGNQPVAGQAAAPKALGPKAPGKIRIGIAPPDAQVGQGNNASSDYSTPIRNAEVALMGGPAVEVAALDSHIPVQLQAEAQQKQCDFIMYSSVAVKHSSGGGFGKFAKFGGMAASMTPMGAMAHGMGRAMAAQAAGMAGSQAAQQQAMNQLAGFTGQIKSKDDVSVQYQLVPTGQTAAVAQNTLQGKAKSDGEDVLTPLLTQAATDVLTKVSQK